MLKVCSHCHIALTEMSFENDSPKCRFCSGDYDDQQIRRGEFNLERVYTEQNNEEVKIYAARYEAKRRYEMELAIETRAHERMFDPWHELPLPVLPYWKKATHFFKWSTW